MPTRVRSAAALLPILVLPLVVPATSTTATSTTATSGPLAAERTSTAAPGRGPGATTFATPTAAAPPSARAGHLAPATYLAPVPGSVAQTFDLPEHPWEPGHRGIDLWASHGSVVAAPGAGVVTFAGSVAGKPTIVVTHPDGLRSSLEPVEATVARGTSVRAGDPVGVLVPTPGGRSNPDHCAALAPPSPDAACVHWGVRRSETYLDPRSLLGAAPPIVLLPAG